MNVFNAVAQVRMASSRALALLRRQQIDFTADRARAVVEMGDLTAQHRDLMPQHQDLHLFGGAPE